MRTPKQPLDKSMMVLGYLTKYGSIGRHTALSHFQIWDLHKVIFRLRKKGHAIETKGKGNDFKYTIPKQAEKYQSKPQQKDLS